MSIYSKREFDDCAHAREVRRTELFLFLATRDVVASALKSKSVVEREAANQAVKKIERIVRRLQQELGRDTEADAIGPVDR